MVRSVRRWLGIAAICLTILFIPVWTGALQAAQETVDHPTFIELPGFGSPPATERGDKDCIGYFETRPDAQRFFIEHGGPGRDPHHLDHDRDGKACEQFDY